MSETVRQHYVPRTYLKHFSEAKKDKYFIGFADVPFTDNKVIKQINIERICVEKHLYTLPGATTEERMWLERIYSDVFEKDYDKMYDMLTDPKKKNVSQPEREFVITTVIAMYYRTTSWNRFAYSVMDDIIERSYFLAKNTPHDHFMFGDRKVVIANKTVEELKKEHREETKTILALNQLRHVMKLSRIRSMSDGLMITKLNSLTDEFVTSDNPVECNNINERHLMPIDPTNTFSLPLDAKHHLTMIPNDNLQYRFIIRRPFLPEDASLLSVLGLNFGQEKNAQKFLLGSQNGLLNYFNTKKEVENPNPGERIQKLKNLTEALNKVL